MYEGINRVKLFKIDLFIYDYEMFVVEFDGFIKDMYDCFINIINEFFFCDKIYSNEE